MNNYLVRYRKSGVNYRRIYRVMVNAESKHSARQAVFRNYGYGMVTILTVTILIGDFTWLSVEKI